jgi:hypothetical protein
MADQLTGHERVLGRGEHCLTAVLRATRVTTVRESLALCRTCLFGCLLIAFMHGGTGPQQECKEDEYSQASHPKSNHILASGQGGGVRQEGL